MTDNYHCPDHCDLCVSVAEIRKDTQYIRKYLNEKKSDFKWIIVTFVSICSLGTSVYAILK